MRENKREQISGFTLIEMMIAVVVIGILAAIAYPSYQESVRKGKRNEARMALMNTMQQQERFYSFHTTYIAFSADSNDDEGKRFRWYSGESSSGSAYEIHAEACDGKHIRDCVQLIATPGTSRVNARHRDPACGRLIVTSEGERRADASHCWQ